MATAAPRVTSVETKATYRGLLLRGLAPDEAANLTAYLIGLHVGELHWKLAEVNQLLFLRELHRSGRFTEPDQGVAPAT